MAPVVIVWLPTLHRWDHRGELAKDGMISLLTTHWPAKAIADFESFVYPSLKKAIPNDIG